MAMVSWLTFKNGVSMHRYSNYYSITKGNIVIGSDVHNYNVAMYIHTCSKLLSII